MAKDIGDWLQPSDTTSAASSKNFENWRGVVLKISRTACAVEVLTPNTAVLEISRTVRQKPVLTGLLTKQCGGTPVTSRKTRVVGKKFLEVMLIEL